MVMLIDIDKEIRQADMHGQEGESVLPAIYTPQATVLRKCKFNK
jgi:hypothetical protein